MLEKFEENGGAAINAWMLLKHLKESNVRKYEY